MTRLPGKNIRFLARMLLLACLGAVLLASVSGGCSCSQTTGTKPKKTVPERAQSSTPTCPLCGLQAQDKAFLTRRPVAVEMMNEKRARPQAGLDKACVVYEGVGESGVTRFVAVFLCRDADPVGPVNKALPADIEILFPYQALFAHAGGSKATVKAIQESGMPDMDYGTWPGAFWRTETRSSPYNIYSATVRLRAAGDTQYPFEGEAAPDLRFMPGAELKKMATARDEEMQRAAEQQAGNPNYQPQLSVVHNIAIPFQKDCEVYYSYDLASSAFLRNVAGTPQVDQTTGRQLTADTVIIQYVMEAGARGAPTPGLIGSGRAQLFMMGQIVDANWEKSSRTVYTRYVDARGNEVKVKPGAIWIEQVPANRPVMFD